MKLNEIYANSGLGKWFKKESATKEPGWDRYNSAGKRSGKCGDAKEGEPYSACLSKQKANRLGKEGIASFVKRKRAAQSEAGRGEKGTGAKGKKPIFVDTGASKKEKVNEHMEPINEGCGCEHSKDKELVKKIKDKFGKKYMKEDTFLGTPVKDSDTPEKFIISMKNDNGIAVYFMGSSDKNKQNTPLCKNWNNMDNASHSAQTIKEYTDFTQLDLTPFKDKSVLVETVDGYWYGTLGVFKENFAVFNKNEIIRSVDPVEVVSFVCENTKIIITETNKPNDPEKWSQCKSQAKSKFDVYPSAYANAWASKCYKKKGGTWRTVKEELDPNLEILNETIKSKDGKWVVMNKAETKVLGTHSSRDKALNQLRAIEANKARHGVHENTDILLKDRLKSIFFETELQEEVVNKDNKGSMTKAELQKRDQIAAKLRKRGNIKRIKTEKRLDSQREAEFRTATFKVLAMRSEKGKKSNKKTDK
jgi:hypothetical protein